eukprot:Lankesteria_metandrocarpae@DN4250_c0_g1_i1.p3
MRIRMTEVLCNKLYECGVISSRNGLADVDKEMSITAFCKRRLPLLLVNLKFSDHLDNAVTLVEHGHIRIGPEVVSNAGLHVTREMEDHIGWARGSEVHRHVQRFTDSVDDFDAC